MLRITQAQLDTLLDHEYLKIGERVFNRWPEMSANLYPGRPEISEQNRRYWIGKAVDVCQRRGVDSEEAVIALALNVLSAVTLDLPIEFIRDMASFFLDYVSHDADFSVAQQWIEWIFLEQERIDKR